jgi:glycine/D-amino acid oxidase-like deaminating enzyme
MDQPFDAVVVGGGFFGASLATHLGRGGARTLLVEAAPMLLARASLVNQARVHAGYHYPRSYLTGLRSRVNAPRFVEEYRECVVDNFDHYYAVGRSFSKVTASQFKRFCDRIGASYRPAPAAAVALFNSAFVEDVVQVPEYAFDAVLLRARVQRDLERAGVEVRLATRATHAAARDGAIAMRLESSLSDDEVRSGRVFNCTYAGLNRLHVASGLPLVPLKHELTEMPLVEPPEALRQVGVTIMCGPFFSMLPYPSRGLHTLSHVRYTPHCSWSDAEGEPYVNADARLAEYGKVSAFPHMVRDAARFLPVMRSCVQRDSLWEIKTVLPRSEADDSRPILYTRNHGIPGFHCVIGSKVDNAYDMLQCVDAEAVPVERAS